MSSATVSPFEESRPHFGDEASVLGGAQNFLLGAGLSALVFVGSTSGNLAVPVVEEIISSSGVAPTAGLGKIVAIWPVDADSTPTGALTTSQLLAQTREASGLTWDQLARYFGVSRRSVHLWAAGGRMTARNEELLMHLTAFIDTLKDLNPAERRQKLLRSDNGLNIIDAERARRGSTPTDLNRSPEIGVPSDGS